VEVAELLMRKGVDPTQADASGWRPMDSACSMGHVEVVELLLGLPWCGGDTMVRGGVPWCGGR
jgi:ankyrin repeat protein